MLGYTEQKFVVLVMLVVASVGLILYGVIDQTEFRYIVLGSYLVFCGADVTEFWAVMRSAAARQERQAGAGLPEG